MNFVRTTANAMPKKWNNNDKICDQKEKKKILERKILLLKLALVVFLLGSKFCNLRFHPSPILFRLLCPMKILTAKNCLNEAKP